METTSQVAGFITQLIKQSGRLQKEIARDSGFDNANVITMIKQGLTKLPLDKVGPMAIALETDAVNLLKMCLEEYHPATWKVIRPHFATALTSDELQLIRSMRSFVGRPYLACIQPESRNLLNELLGSLSRHAAPVQ